MPGVTNQRENEPPPKRQRTPSLFPNRPEWMTAYQCDQIVQWVEEQVSDELDQYQCTAVRTTGNELLFFRGRSRGKDPQFVKQFEFCFNAAHITLELNAYDGAARVRCRNDIVRLPHRLPAVLRRRHPFNDHTQDNVDGVQQLWEKLTALAAAQEPSKHAVSLFVNEATPFINAVFALVMGKKCVVVERRHTTEVEYVSRTPQDTIAMYCHSFNVRVRNETFNKQGVITSTVDVPTPIPVMKRWLQNTSGRLEYARRVFNPRECGTDGCAGADELNAYTGIAVYPKATAVDRSKYSTVLDCRFSRPDSTWVLLDGSIGEEPRWERISLAALSKGHQNAYAKPPSEYRTSLETALVKRAHTSKGTALRSFRIVEDRAWFEARLANFKTRTLQHCSAVAACHAAVYASKGWEACRTLTAAEETEYQAALRATEVSVGQRRACVAVPSFVTSSRVLSMMQRTIPQRDMDIEQAPRGTPLSPERLLKTLQRMYAVRPFLDHLWSIWCANAPNAFPYVHRWIASTIQRPAFKVKVALVLKSRPRAGKGIVMELLTKVLGQKYFSQPARMEDVTDSSFNEHLLGNCLLLFLDEAFWGGDKKVKGALKKLITEPLLNIGQKYEVGYLAENCFNMILASNEKHVVNMDIDSGKLVVLDCSNQYAGKTDNPAAKKRYMDRVRSTDAQALSNYLHWDVDLTHWNPFDIPSTQGSTDQVARSFAPDLKFIVKVLNDPTMLADTKIKSHSVFDGKTLDRTAVYAMYSKGVAHPESPHMFWKTWKHIGAVFPKKTVTNKHGVATRSLTLPTLHEARERFRCYVNISDFPFDDVYADTSVDNGDDPWAM